ncbi:hypothetical protein D6C84_04724 [Aureobasidium pullulans]|uniref:Uncharacterized protein n=1 Tax=Aureobasidium pullulans TaxID=5580 RepID=A0A4S9XYX0_AURPU|nr:hypothetical protein D6C84_04724 [Aureobasidium pullulans]
MGAALSSPQLGDGLVSVDSSSSTPVVPFVTAFSVASTDTNSFGFSAAMTDAGYSAHIRYTDSAHAVSTLDCSIATSSTDHNTGGFTETTTYGSVLCPVANTEIGTGTMFVTIDVDPLAYTGWQPGTYAIYVGPSTVTTTGDITVSTAVVPGQITYLATETSTVYRTTKTVAATTTLTGAYAASRCTSVSKSTPTTLLKTTVKSSSTGISSLKSSASASSSSKSLSGSSSTRKATTSSSKSTVFLRSSSTSRAFMSSKTSNSKSKSSSSKSSLRSTTLSSSRITSSPPSCNTGTIVRSLSSYPPLASHLCREVISRNRAIPASISVFPDSQLSSACSCYMKPTAIAASSTKKSSLSKRQDMSVDQASILISTPSTIHTSLAQTSTEVADDSGFTTSEGPTVETPSTTPLALEISTSTTVFSSSSSLSTESSTSDTTISSSSTTTLSFQADVTSVSGYGPPTAYSISTTTLYKSTQTVYSTAQPKTSSATTITISSATLTVSGSSVVTVDKRTQPTTCVGNSNTVTLSARSLSCDNLKLHTTFLWVMMGAPFDFCAYYLTANRNISPLSEMSASTLKDTCSCLIQHKTYPLPVFKEQASFSPKSSRVCKQDVGKRISALFQESDVFCKFYTSTARSVSPFVGVSPAEIFAGCKCLA